LSSDKVFQAVYHFLHSIDFIRIKYLRFKSNIWLLVNYKGFKISYLWPNEEILILSTFQMSNKPLQVGKVILTHKWEFFLKIIFDIVIFLPNSSLFLFYINRTNFSERDNAKNCVWVCACVCVCVSMYVCFVCMFVCVRVWVRRT